jgi:ankyrin repeat protein
MGGMNIVIYLLQHDANPDVPTVRGETPLHLAARANQTDIIRILLRNGAQVDAHARVDQFHYSLTYSSFLIPEGKSSRAYLMRACFCYLGRTNAASYRIAFG